MPRQAALPHLASSIAAWFPELNGRCIAVSEADVFDKSNIPRLPIGMVSLLRSAYGGGTGKNNKNSETSETIIVQMYFPPVRYRLGAGTAKDAESPFYAYYEYEPIEDRMRDYLWDYISPRGGIITLNSMDQESDQLSVTLSFQMTHNYKWCRPTETRPETTGHPVQITGPFARAFHPALCNCNPMQANCSKCQPAVFIP